MSLPLNQQAPPVVTVATQPSYNNVHVSHGSIGPVIAVLIVIMILGVIAVVVGRMCSGKRIMGYGQFDVESWAERKCSSCIDGRINAPIPRANGSVTSVPVSSAPAQTH
ncbi:hypothetical protein L484_014453 [Morus notabilis]|uniref:Uncharacterized protein n=1 Tax=Morus notabilis TaxID=981085 RepID=W9QUE2_9ROSA|nr:hypothetical protein L484_014453 [Morus notabilis]